MPNDRRRRPPHEGSNQHDLAQSMAALHAWVAYDAEIDATPAGRESRALREAGHSLTARGYLHEAHENFLRAVALCERGVTGAAAASAWFDLAESYCRRRDGIKVENLLRARELFGRCLDSDVRRRTPLRNAASHDAMGRVLRALVREGVNLDSTALAEAEQHFREAIGIARACGPLGMRDAAGYRHNLGNLYRQQGRPSDAEEAYRRALEDLAVYRRLPDEFRSAMPEPIEDLGTHLQLTFAEVLLERGGEARLRQALDRLRIASRSKDPTTRATAHMLSARAELAKRNVDRREVRSHLDAVVWCDLRPENMAVFVDLLCRAELPDRAVRVLDEAIEDAVRRRTAALSDHAADHAAGDAQTLARTLAALHLQADRPVAAFLALESVASLRYMEAALHAGLFDEDPVTRALRHRHRAYSATVMQLAQLASLMSRVEAAEAGRIFAEYRDSLSPIDGDDANEPTDHVLKVEAHEAIAEALREARGLLNAEGDASTPVEAVQRASQHLRSTALRFARLADARSPEDALARASHSLALDEAGLTAMVAERPGTVFVRVHLTHELLASAVWHDGALRSRGMRTSLDRASLDALNELLRAARDPEAKPSSMDGLLRALDLTAILPDGPFDHLVILPSIFAALVPWGAVGVAGATPLDRAARITVLPNLTPLRVPPVVLGGRSETLLVAPGASVARGATRFHDVAFGVVGDNERLLAGGEATKEAVRVAAGAARVVSFFAHGRHVTGECAEIQMADGAWAPWEFGSDWRSCERVELWACASGVNLPSDPLTPVVDEAFGIDIAFHGAGARSTVASLWPVSDFVTAQIARRFRQAVREGIDPARALADAQRWWRDNVVPELPSLLEDTPELRLADAIVAVLGDPSAVDVMEAELGPLARDAPVRSDARAAILTRFASPLAWAGFRFVGVGEAATKTHVVERVRPMNPAERAELDALVRAASEVADPDTVRRAHLRSLTADAVSAARAIEVARAFASRGLGAARHNLLRAAAWLHEALAAESNPRVWQALQLEVAWVWLELARGEHEAEPLGEIYRRDPIYASRAREMVRGIASSGERVVISVWLDALQSPPSSWSRVDDAVWRATCAAVGSIKDQVWQRRTAALALEWFLGHRESGPQALDAAFALLDALPLSDDGERDLYADARIGCSAALLDLRRDVGREPPPPIVLSSRDLARSSSWIAQAAQQEFLDRDDVTVRASAMIDRLEQAHWGTLEAPFEDFCDASGAPGLAWHRVVGAYLAGRFAMPDAVLPLHHLASLQLGADLRLAAIHRMARRAPRNTERATLAQLLWRREQLLTRLEDLARLPAIAEGALPAASADADAFQLPMGALVAAGEASPWALTGWIAAHDLNDADAKTARTGAFAVARELDALDAAIASSVAAVEAAVALTEPASDAGALLRRAAVVASLLPMRRITDIESGLSQSSPAVAWLGASIGGGGELLLSVVLGGSPATRRARVVGEGSGWALKATLTALIAPRPEDHGRSSGTSTDRAEAFDALCRILDGALGALLGPVSGERRVQLRVLAPGPLRALPWSGLTAGGVPLRDRFSAVSLLPWIDFDDQPIATPSELTLCALSDEREHGDASFGACAVATVRRSEPRTIATEAHDRRRGTDVVESEAIERFADEVAVVRWYGVGFRYTVNATTEGVGLSLGRSLTERNLACTSFRRCRRVEYWAATGDLGALMSVSSGDRDAIPALVWAALASGTEGVLDLAWPVHDLVKALVFERFAWELRHAPEAPSSALAAATRAVAALLARWRDRGSAFDSPANALAWLDEARKGAAREAGVDPALVVAFSSSENAVESARDLAGLMKTCAAASQLGSFRWWGR